MPTFLNPPSKYCILPHQQSATLQNENYIDWYYIYSPKLCFNLSYQRTPLHIAVKEFQVRTMKFLVGKRADINSKDNDGVSMHKMVNKEPFLG